MFPSSHLSGPSLLLFWLDIMIDLGSRAWPFEHDASPGGVNKLWVYNENDFTKGIWTDAQNDLDHSYHHGGQLKDAERKWHSGDIKENFGREQVQLWHSFIMESTQLPAQQSQQSQLLSFENFSGTFCLTYRVPTLQLHSLSSSSSSYQNPHLWYITSMI